MIAIRRLRCVVAFIVTMAASVFASSASMSAELNVVVTIKPIHAIVAAVMRGVGEPRLLIDGGASPHAYSLKPSDARDLQRADVVIRVSDTLEPFTIKVLATLAKRVTVIDLINTPGLLRHRVRTGDGFEDHVHEKKGRHDHGHGHAHGHGHGHGHGAKGKEKAWDAHVWLDPANAVVIARHVAEVLAGLRPELAQHLRNNAMRFVSDAELLARELEASVADLRDRPYIVFHDAYQYFERRYGLSAVGSVSVSPEVPPSARRLSALRAKVAKLGATCIFAEPQFAPKVIETIAEGTKARKGVLDPLGAAIPAGPEHYAGLLRGLAADLKRCLSDPS